MYKTDKITPVQRSTNIFPCCVYMLCRMLKPPPLKKYPKTQKQLTKRVSYKHFKGGQMVVYQSDQIKLGSRLVESKVHRTSMEADRKQTVNSRKDQHENRRNTYKRIAIVHVFIRTTRPGGVRSKFSRYFFSERTDFIGY